VGKHGGRLGGPFRGNPTGKSRGFTSDSGESLEGRELAREEIGNKEDESIYTFEMNRECGFSWETTGRKSLGRSVDIYETAQAQRTNLGQGLGETDSGLERKGKVGDERNSYVKALSPIGEGNRWEKMSSRRDIFPGARSIKKPQPAAHKKAWEENVSRKSKSCSVRVAETKKSRFEKSSIPKKSASAR